MDPRSQYTGFFEKEILKHYEYVRKFILTATQDHQLASDITQETMATAWDKIFRVCRYSDVKHALRTIARNKLYDYYKKNKSCKVQLPLPEICERFLTEEDGLRCLIKNEERHALLAAIGDLPEESGRIILLRYYYGESFLNVAKMTGTNYNTVLSRHRRALKTLKARLKEK